jgi:hypothetical protein
VIHSKAYIEIWKLIKGKIQIAQWESSCVERRKLAATIPEWRGDYVRLHPSFASNGSGRVGCVIIPHYSLRSTLYAMYSNYWDHHSNSKTAVLTTANASLDNILLPQLFLMILLQKRNGTEQL